MSGPDVVECPCGWKLPTNVKRMLDPETLVNVRVHKHKLRAVRIQLSCPVCGQIYAHQPPVVGLDDDN